MIDAGLMFVLGLATSLHCVQMCGPIVLAFGLPFASQSRVRQSLAHATYHAGRITTYAILGALAGYLGAGASTLTRLAGFEQGAALAIGTVMVISGLLLSGLFQRSEHIQITLPAPFYRATGRFLRKTRLRARLAAGLLLGCLPCGLLYAALLRSAAAASPLQSSLSMAAFGLGTAGPLLGLGLFSATINRRFGVGGPRLAAACVSVMGALLIWRGVMPVVGRVHPFH